MANYRTITVGAVISDHIASASASVADMIIAAGATIATDIRTSDMPVYDGAYEVTPEWYAQTLATRNKQMADDVTVKSIQLELVSNLSGGKTAYIGGIIDG